MADDTTKGQDERQGSELLAGVTDNSPSPLRHRSRDAKERAAGAFGIRCAQTVQGALPPLRLSIPQASKRFDV